jgi:prepilin peptidase CpaA
LQALTLALAIGFFTTAAWDDLCARQIPNAVSLGIGALALVRLIPAGDPSPALWTLAAAGAVFAFAFLQWRLGFLGGGDAKLMAAAALLVGYRDIPGFLLLMGLAGGVLALVVFGANRLGRPAALLLPSSGELEARARPSIPYGIAIAFAGSWVLIQQYSLMK